MELWIRSQDKECLMKVDRLDYDVSNYKHRIVVNGYQTLVAEYETKKRALEVLDDIESLLCGNTRDKGLAKGIGIRSKNAQNLIYEMPKE